MGERPPFDWHRPIGPSEAQKARDAERMSQLAVEAMKRQVKAMLTDPTPATPDEADLLETAWGIIANAGGGDWTTQTYEWASAAARWRSDYFAYLDSRQQGDAVAGVYRERARLVAALARLYPASLERADPSPGFEWVVYVDLPTGQASWHVSDDDLDLFDGTPRGQGRKWDGHDDAEKHRRVDALGRGDAVAARVDEAMVGRVARALCDERGEDWDWTVAHDPGFADALRTDAREALLGVGDRDGGQR